MRRALHIAVAALAAVATADARAQFRAGPMVLPAPGVGTNVLPMASNPAAPSESDLLAIGPSAAGSSLRRHHDMISRLASPVAQPATFQCAAAGRLAENGSDAATDVAFCAGAGEIQIAFGDAQSVLRAYPWSLNFRQQPTLGFAHLLPRAADVIVLPYGTGVATDLGSLEALDFDASTSPAITSRSWLITGRTQRQDPDEVLTMRLGSNARALGVDDLYLPGSGSVQIFENLTPAGASSLSQVVFATPIVVGWDAPGTGGRSSIPGFPRADCQGAAPLYNDPGGPLGLVVSLSSSYKYAASPAGQLVWIPGGPSVADLAAAQSWTDLTGTFGLADPVVIRPVEIAGNPAVAVWDRGLDQIVLITSTPAAGASVAWRGSAAGRNVRDIRLADLVGSPAPDLVVDGTGLLETGHAPVSPAILVFPDVGDASPTLAWAAGSPGVPSRGEDHRMEVVAGDADGPFRVDWMVGDPWGVPAATGTSAYVQPGATLCDPPPQQLAVTVRAVDDLGVYAEIAASLEVATPPPHVEIAGAVPPGRLALPPGGTSTVVEGSGWTACAVVLEWTGTPWPSGAQVTTEQGPGWTRQTVVLPEPTYPELLSGDPVVTLTATDPALASPQAATLPIELDATGLVVAEIESDLAAIAPGDVALLRTRIRSRIGVPLPAVRVVNELDGLSPAGSPTVTGGQILALGRSGAEVVLAFLPPAGSEVVVELPVRALGGRAASAVEVRSSGGHLLTPPAAAPAEALPAPGCGCGSSPGPSALAALALLALRPRRAHGRPLT